jgi:pimeloyl-ACP methyl ester carboxylesterase
MAALYADALTVYDAALRHPGVQPERVVLLGRSLGSGVATYLAAHRPARGVVLVAPFDSMTAVAQRHYSWAPIAALIRNPFPSVDYARQVQAPVLMIAGARDDIIPAEHAKRLLEAWAGPKELAILAGAGHNDIQGHSEYYPRINGFLDRLGE